MERLYLLLVCVSVVCLILLIIDFNFSKNRKWLIPIGIMTVFTYLFVWQFRPLRFNEITNLSSNTPGSYQVMSTNYKNGEYVKYCIDSEQMESDQEKKGIWWDILEMLSLSEYRQDIRCLLPRNTDNILLDENGARDSILIEVVSSDGIDKYQITIIFEGFFIKVLDVNTSEIHIYHYLNGELINNLDEYIQRSGVLL